MYQPFGLFLLCTNAALLYVSWVPRKATAQARRPRPVAAAVEPELGAVVNVLPMSRLSATMQARGAEDPRAVLLVMLCPYRVPSCFFSAVLSVCLSIVCCLSGKSPVVCGAEKRVGQSGRGHG